MSVIAVRNVNDDSRLIGCPSMIDSQTMINISVMAQRLISSQSQSSLPDHHCDLAVLTWSSNV